MDILFGVGADEPLQGSKMNRSSTFRTWLSVWTVVSCFGAATWIIAGVAGINSAPTFHPVLVVPLIIGFVSLLSVGMLNAAGRLAAGAADDLGQMVHLLHQQQQAARARVAPTKSAPAVHPEDIDEDLRGSMPRPRG